jgi:hypothetical protein
MKIKLDFVYFLKHGSSSDGTLVYKIKYNAGYLLTYSMEQSPS